jgi:phosphatidylglycerol:prolipoprotein diacylglycerol transferase
MLTYPNISPVIFKLGPLELRWYGLMYVIGFILAYFLIRYEARRRNLKYTDDELYDFIFYLILGVIIGGRIGYILFYNLPWYLAHPVEMLMINKGGMSFHGGLIGTILAAFIFCKKRKLNFYQMVDMGAMSGSIGLGFGRLGNFINGELYGRVAPPDYPLAMIFPTDPTGLPRHPSQLYESFFEGFIMFSILFIFSKKKLKPGIMFWMFIMLYGLFRFFIEFTREPDSQLGLFGGVISMGQILCLPMFLLGLSMIIKISLTKTKEPEADLQVETETKAGSELKETDLPASTPPVIEKSEPAVDEAILKFGKGTYARIKTNLGDIICRLFRDKAPKTVANFAGLATGEKEYKDPRTKEKKKGKFFDGIIFHRVIPDFMIQTGDPLGEGYGGPGYDFADEFHPNLTHYKAGILSMANSGPNTNGSQFFITLAATPYLDNKHSVFGEVVEGMDVAVKIGNVDRDRDDKPLEKVFMESVDIFEVP